MRRIAMLPPVVAALLALAISAAALAQPKSEALGPVTPVTEPDMLEQIEQHLQGMERRGDLKRIEQEAVERARRNIESPPARQLPRAMRTRTWTWDPSVVANRDVQIRGVGTVVKAGTRVNPLDYVAFAQFWVFFDANDPQQSAFAQRMIKERRELVKPIAVSGNWAALTRAWGQMVYFDQGAREGATLTQRFGIQALPATLQRDGAMLRLTEVLLDGRDVR